METETCERFPLRIVLLSVGLALAIYALGASLLGQLHPLLLLRETVRPGQGLVVRAAVPPGGSGALCPADAVLA